MSSHTCFLCFVFCPSPKKTTCFCRTLVCLFTRDTEGLRCFKPHHHSSLSLNQDPGASANEHLRAFFPCAWNRHSLSNTHTQWEPWKPPQQPWLIQRDAHKQTPDRLAGWLTEAPHGSSGGAVPMSLSSGGGQRPDSTRIAQSLDIYLFISHTPSSIFVPLALYCNCPPRLSQLQCVHFKPEISVVGLLFCSGPLFFVGSPVFLLLNVISYKEIQIYLVKLNLFK